MAWVVAGTLDGPFGPWMAQGSEGPVVLRRSGGPLRRTGSSWVVDAERQVVVDGQTVDMEAYIAGGDLEPGGLDDGQRRAVLGMVARGLEDLHRHGVGHGRMGPGAVRRTEGGSVRLVGARRGPPEEDADALHELASYLWDDPPSDLGPLEGEGAITCWAASPCQLLPRIETQEPKVMEHDWTGRTVGEMAPAGPERPPRVQVALIAALTLVLGLATGALLSGCSSPEVTLHVPGALQVSVYCGGETYRTEGPNQDTLVFVPATTDRNHCDVEAPLSPVMPLRGTLDLVGPGRYHCERDGVVWVCGREG